MTPLFTHNAIDLLVNGGGETGIELVIIQYRQQEYASGGAFAKLRKATLSFVMSVRPSFRMGQLSSHWTDFHEIWYSSIIRKSVKKIQVSLEFDINNGHFT
jgi:hypothetical protein